MTRPTAFSVRFNHSRNICKAPAPPKNNNNAKGKKKVQPKLHLVQPKFERSPLEFLSVRAVSKGGTVSLGRPSVSLFAARSISDV